jgi:hypothetical protein
MLVEADAAQEAIERVRAEPQGIVRVSCPSPLPYFQVAEMGSSASWPNARKWRCDKQSFG